MIRSWVLHGSARPNVASIRYLDDSNGMKLCRRLEPMVQDSHRLHVCELGSDSGWTGYAMIEVSITRNLFAVSCVQIRIAIAGISMDRTDNGGNGFKAFMAFIIGLASIGAGISIYFTGIN